MMYVFLILIAGLLIFLLAPVFDAWYRCPNCGALKMRETGNRMEGRYQARIEVQCSGCGYSEYRDEPPAG